MANTLQEIWNLISRSNKYIDETAPWTLAKDESEDSKEKLKSVIYHLIENLRRVAILLNPFMENTSNEIFRQIGLGEKEELKTWESLSDYDKLTGAKVIEKGEPLFMRLNPEEEVQYIKSKMGA
jgi:methionyl-tRNA synthetase